MNPILKNAQFITTEEKNSTVSPVFRKEFSLPAKVASASLSITARGVYEAHLNGERVGDFILAPGFTSYNKRLQVQTYDVTGLLRETNTLDILLGNGWHHGTISRGKFTGCDRSVIASLDITYADGRSESIVTDKSWLYSKTGILHSDLYDGETFDANVSFGAWKPCVETEGLRDALILQEGEIVRKIESIPAVNLFITPKGERVIDFGQEITGYVEFRTVGEIGSRIVIDHCEMLDKDGNFYTENYRAARSRVTYITDGCTERRYHPFFSFQGFRYIRLTEYPTNDVYIGDFRAIVVHSDMRRIGHFTCSDPLVNRLYENVIWGQRDNFLDIPTDCPQRDERLGWTGDAQVFCRTAAYNYDVRTFFKKWLHDLAADQSPEGAVPQLVPCVHGLNPAFAWGDAATVCPWELYLAYGDKTVLSEQFDSMAAWVRFIRNKGDTPEAWAAGNQYGDWLGLDAAEGSYRGATDNKLLAAAFLAYSAELVAKAGRVLGRDISEYEAIRKLAADSFTSQFVGEDGMLTCETQTAYVVALAFGLAPDRMAYASHLADMIKKNGSKLKTGFIGTAYIMDALSENGQAETAYSLLLQTEFPSWLYSVRKGATTIWEHWDSLKPDGSMWSKDMNSFNHYAYGAVAAWLYGTVAGIRPDETHPGYENILIRPIPDKRLRYANATLETLHGTVQSGWKQVNGGFEITVTVPDGASADITVGALTEHRTGGVYTYFLDDRT